ncbi:Uncharacterized protein Fot_35612 [Forsythia ovata]|uniref:Uncharacterized protein n=1 Tax=Forsythia ovata TaxID=205694 RepID=A0ABD1SNF6_9LAMI
MDDDNADDLLTALTMSLLGSRNEFATPVLKEKEKKSEMLLFGPELLTAMQEMIKNEQPSEEAEEALEIAQPQRHRRRSRARLAHNMELMAAQMLEMQQQQADQTSESPIRRNNEVESAQLHDQGYDAEENYSYPCFLPKYSQELEPCQASSVFDRLGSRPLGNVRERMVAAAASKVQHIPPTYRYQPSYAKMSQPTRRLAQVPAGRMSQTK